MVVNVLVRTLGRDHTSGYVRVSQGSGENREGGSVK